MDWGVIQEWDWATIANIAGGAAAIATILAAVSQSLRAGTAFTRYERWSRIRQDASNAWEVTHAEERRRHYLVEFVATSDSRAERVGYVISSVFWIAVLVGFMWLTRSVYPDGRAEFLWWIALGVVLIIAVLVYFVPKGRLDRARKEVQLAMGYDVAPLGQTDAPTPADMARELRLTDGGRAIRSFLNVNYPDHPSRSRWNLTPEQVRKVKKRFGPNA